MFDSREHITSFGVVLLTGIGLLTLIGLRCWAWDVSHINYGSASAGAAYSGIAVPEKEDAAAGNPALIPYLTGYRSGFGVVYPTYSGIPVGYRVFISENQTDTLIPTALIYSTYPLDGGRMGQNVRLNVGRFFRPQKNWSWGLGLGYERAPQAMTGVSGEDQGKESWGGVLGFTYRLSFGFLLGGRWETLGQAGVGLSWAYEELLRLRGERNSHGWGMGMEFFLWQWVVGRVGYLHSDEGYNFWTWGVGFVGPRLSFHYAWVPWRLPQKPFEGDHWHRFDISVGLW